MRMLAAVACAAVIASTGCEKAARNMYDQPRYKTFAASPLWADGTSARVPPAGTIARSAGVLADTSSGALGVLAADGGSAAPPSRALYDRGHQRFDIYCAPCHSVRGDGDGFIARRGFPHPPSYGEARLRAAPDRHFYDEHIQPISFRRIALRTHQALDRLQGRLVVTLRLYRLDVHGYLRLFDTCFLQH